MIFQKPAVKQSDFSISAHPEEPGAIRDEVETVVGPSVNVEGDFGSEGNIVVKGTVSGSVRTSKHLFVEMGAKIMANVKAGTSKVSGEVKGNIKVKDTLELTATARVLGDIDAKILIIEAGAIVSGRVSMPGLEGVDAKAAPRLARLGARRLSEEAPAVTL
ncbi:MAG: polymer-forming cytoskeletal protein [Candidatus Magasanikbacteria bacterium]|nr:polymer-forming cytoskeletal protein [Candidatus Magasanikbacteria bacterium]